MDRQTERGVLRAAWSQLKMGWAGSSLRFQLISCNVLAIHLLKFDIRIIYTSFIFIMNQLRATYITFTQHTTRKLCIYLLYSQDILYIWHTANFPNMILNADKFSHAEFFYVTCKSEIWLSLDNHYITIFIKKICVWHQTKTYHGIITCSFKYTDMKHISNHLH